MTGGHNLFNNAVHDDDITTTASHTDALRHLSHIEGYIISTEASFELDCLWQHQRDRYFSKLCGRFLSHLIAHEFIHGVYLCCPNY